jgi:hypothetical protein|tara:strand:+ start:686 stop:961 length:276 start_codon:yes stop_codon:yes gene_type:complete
VGGKENNKSYDLKPGDIIIDLKNKELGFLIRRFSLLEEVVFGKETYPSINAWDILWTGPHLSGKPRRPEAYTENGLINMLNSGVLVLLRDI